MRDTNSSLKWRRRKLAFTCLVIALCFALGNDLYRAKAIVIKNKDLFGGEKRVINYLDATKGRTVGAKFRSDLSQRFLIDPKRKVQENMLSVLAGADTCPGTVINALPFNDSGTTVGLVDNYNMATDTTDPTLTGCPACTGVSGGGPVAAGPRGGVYTGTGTGPDAAWTITFNQTANLNVALGSTTGDLALFVYTSVCSNNLSDGIVVDDDGFAGDTEDVTIGGMPAGTYNILADGYGNESGPYTLMVTGTVQPAAPNVQHVVDTDGDGRTDEVVVRNTGGGPSGQVTWFDLQGLSARPGDEEIPEGSTVRGIAWGIATDFFVPEDYDGDNKTDIAVWRAGAPGNSFFYILNSNGGTVDVINFGQTGDDPSVIGDYDGDGKADIAVYRAGANPGDPSNWWYRKSTVGGPGCTPANCVVTQWGQNGDFEAPGDYDGDGKFDFMIQRNDGGGLARFWLRESDGPISTYPFGTPTDIVLPGDYDGDGKTDIMTARSISGSINWFLHPSAGPDSKYVVWGISASDFPVQGDYDGDGKTDIAVWRGGTGFLIRKSSGGTAGIPWGQNGDYPVANYNQH